MNYIIFVLLFPFSMLFEGIVYIRNKLYDFGIIKSVEFNTPAIVVGNLRAGGTGKTPLVEYLINLLQKNKEIAILSRGYGRTTKGYILADAQSNAETIGDEPMQIKHKFPNILVSVCERRVLGMQRLEHLSTPPGVVILDDAYQHRNLKAGLYILVTEYGRLYTDDWVLPLGRLREPSTGAKRAHIIIVSKCPCDLKTEDILRIRDKLKPQSYQTLVFSSIYYEPLKDAFTNDRFTVTDDNGVLIVTGIASNAKFNAYLNDKVKVLKMIRYKDHYQYTLKDVELIIHNCIQLHQKDPIVITTEKDAVKLIAYKDIFKRSGVKILVQPITVSFLYNDKTIFDSAILNFLANGKYRKSSTVGF